MSSAVRSRVCRPRTTALDDVLQTVDLLYAAALDRQLWPAALDRLAEMTGGIGTVVLSASRMSAQALASESLLEAGTDYVKNEWWRHDIVREAGIRHGCHAGLVSHHDLVSAETQRRHPFIQEFWRKHGICGSLSHCSVLSPGDAVVFAIQRGLESCDFEAEEVRALQALGPHAARALQIGERIDEADTRAASLESSLDRFAVAAVLVDRRSRVIFINERARELTGGAYDIARGTLRATTSAGQKALDLLLKSAFDRPQDEPRQALVPMPDGSPGLLAQSFKVPRRTASPFVASLPGDSALLVLTETAQNERPRPSAALRALGLTPAEARVASLIGAGLSPAEAAVVLDIKLSTVRVEIKSVFAKLDVRRQSELANLVTRLTTVRQD